jgi:hypothetical protein
VPASYFNGAEATAPTNREWRFKPLLAAFSGEAVKIEGVDYRFYIFL